MEDRELKIGGLYRHFKGNLYQVIAVATHSETREELVIYQALYGDFKVYARPVSMFLSEKEHGYRFEAIDRDSLNKKEYIIEKQEEKQEKSNVDQGFMAFLDADSINDKIEVFEVIRKNLNDSVISGIEISLDMPVGSGDLEQRADSIRKHLLMHAKFEGNRLR